MEVTVRLRDRNYEYVFDFFKLMALLHVELTEEDVLNAVRKALVNV